MRFITVLLFASLAFAQSTGKPGVTDPIEDPRQIPGNPNPGAIPPREPQPVKPRAERNRKADPKDKTETEQKKDKEKKNKSSRSKQ